MLNSTIFPQVGRDVIGYDMMPYITLHHNLIFKYPLLPTIFSRLARRWYDGYLCE
jgi:hypothetical protein